MDCLELKGEKGIVGDLLLDDHAGSGKHCQTAVAELLLLHGGELLGIGGLEAKGVESDVSGVVAIVELGKPGGSLDILVLDHGLLGHLPACVGTAELGDGDSGGEEGEEEGSGCLDLGEVGVGGAGDGAVEEGVEILGNEVSDGGEHGDTAVGNLGLTEALDFLDGEVVGKSEGVEVAEGGDGTR